MSNDGFTLIKGKKRKQTESSSTPARAASAAEIVAENVCNYKTKRCSLPNCSSDTCYDYHMDSDRRRRPVDADDLLLYSEEHCKYYDEHGKNCPKGISCRCAHTRLEVMFHPNRYRTKLCAKSPGCHGKQCAFAHNNEELRIGRKHNIGEPVGLISLIRPATVPKATSAKPTATTTATSTLQPQPKTKSVWNTTHDSPPLLSTVSPSRSHAALAIGSSSASSSSPLPHASSLTTTTTTTTTTAADDFDVFTFKTIRCTRQSCSKAQTCPFYHSQADRRRDLRVVPYTVAEVCPPHNRTCDDDCPHIHSDHEYLYHPRHYKTRECKQKKNCAREGFCAFYHNKSEKRIASDDFEDEFYERSADIAKRMESKSTHAPFPRGVESYATQANLHQSPKVRQSAPQSNLRAQAVRPLTVKYVCAVCFNGTRKQSEIKQNRTRANCPVCRQLEVAKRIVRLDGNRWVAAREREMGADGMPKSKLSLCHVGEKKCRAGSRCVYAHSEDELTVWKRDFEYEEYIGRQGNAQKEGFVGSGPEGITLTLRERESGWKGASEGGSGSSDEEDDDEATVWFDGGEAYSKTSIPADLTHVKESTIGEKQVSRKALARVCAREQAQAQEQGGQSETDTRADGAGQVLMEASQYRDWMHALLFMEENQQNSDVAAFNRRNVVLEKRAYYFSDMDGRQEYAPLGSVIFAVSVADCDLSERRPSVLRQDFVRVTPATSRSDNSDRTDKNRPSDDSLVYGGSVVAVEATAVVFLLHECFAAVSDSGRFDVAFESSRRPFAVMHRAINEVNPNIVMHSRLPKAAKAWGSRNKCQRFEFFDKDLNKEQQAGVNAVLSAGSVSVPVLVCGSFGTGKTRTLVEIIRQLATSHNRILVCTHLNVTADAYVRRLSKCPELQPGQLLRLYATDRIPTVATDLRPFCCMTSDGAHLAVPSQKAMSIYRVVVCTLIASDELRKSGMKGQFTHIICDEGAQILEAEAIVPMCLAVHNTKIVLAGDPQQAGPVVLSERARSLRLDMSLLERLSLSPAYSSAEARDFRVDLRLNYRCHHEIVHLVSDLFYKSSLEPAPDLCIDLPGGVAHPLAAMHVQGASVRDEQSPSFFNDIEARKTAEAVSGLVEKWGVSPQDIAVVAPFRKQAHYIRSLLRRNPNRSLQLRNVWVRTTAEIQGLEFSVLVVSTVRTLADTRVDNDWVSFDHNHHLGLLDSPQAMNTIITRARRYVLVVGDTYLLEKDAYWGTFIETCKRQKALYDREDVTGAEEESVNKGAVGVVEADAPSVVGASSVDVSSKFDQEASLTFGGTTATHEMLLAALSEDTTLSKTQRKKQKKALAAAAAAAAATARGGGDSDVSLSVPAAYPSSGVVVGSGSSMIDSVIGPLVESEPNEEISTTSGRNGANGTSAVNMSASNPPNSTDWWPSASDPSATSTGGTGASGASPSPHLHHHHHHHTASSFGGGVWHSQSSASPPSVPSSSSPFDSLYRALRALPHLVQSIPDSPLKRQFLALSESQLRQTDELSSVYTQLQSLVPHISSPSTSTNTSTPTITTATRTANPAATPFYPSSTDSFLFSPAPQQQQQQQRQQLPHPHTPQQPLQQQLPPQQPFPGHNWSFPSQNFY